jgi:hypothetical protein
MPMFKVLKTCFSKVSNSCLLIHPKIQVYEFIFKFSQNSCCNYKLHHFPLIPMLLKVPQTFMPSWNGWDTFILNYFWHLSILEIDKWIHRYKASLWQIHLQVVYVLLHMKSNIIKSRPFGVHNINFWIS